MFDIAALNSLADGHENPRIYETAVRKCEVLRPSGSTAQARLRTGLTQRYLSHSLFFFLHSFSTSTTFNLTLIDIAFFKCFDMANGVYIYLKPLD